LEFILIGNVHRSIEGLVVMWVLDIKHTPNRLKRRNGYMPVMNILLPFLHLSPRFINNAYWRSSPVYYLDIDGGKFKIFPQT
jgi:hypothetical protein